jgi:3-oxoacyl-[acyl-carrier protein] reductase
MFSIAGKSVLVTGGSKGIGRGIASVFATADANVAIGARSQADIDSSVAALDGLGSGKVIGVAVDVSDRESCTAMAAAVVGAFGGLDVLCANAGIFPDAPLQTMTPDQLTEVLDVNVKGTVYSVQACLDALIASGRGRIVLTSSITARSPGFPAGRTTAHPRPPSWVSCGPPDRTRPAQDHRQLGDDYLAQMARAIPAGALGAPEDIGYAAAFLASDEADFIAGQAIVVDGGQVLPESPDVVTP